jgi:CRP/FNR family transcriptional regulator, nitrogen fixation regulation protein
MVAAWKVTGNHDEFHIRWAPIMSIQGIGAVRSYVYESEIVRENDLAEHIYEVISGTVCTWRMPSDGRRQIAGFYFAGDVFGLENVKNHSLTAQAITDVKARVVRKQVLNALASSDAKVAQQLLSLTAVELARQQELHLLLCRPAQERVIHFLIDMAQRASPNEYDLIYLSMTRQDIADYLGLTIETVSRMLREIERRGAIKIKGRHTVMLCNRSATARVPTKELRYFFEGVTGRRPKTDQELNEWLASPDGKAATLFEHTSASRWGERARA